jgi:restriction system protein
MKYQGTYEIFFNQEEDEYALLNFPPLETDNKVLAEVERVYPSMKVLLSKVKNGDLDRELAAIQQGKPLPIYEPEKITLILEDVSRKFVQLIAEDSRYLDNIEWRDLERALAEVFNGLGFVVELTPGSKDGGKDIVVECVVSGLQSTYIIEIKHWRSGKHVNHKDIRHFLNVIISEKRNGGLFLSTSGYSHNIFSSFTEIERLQLKIGDKSKIVSLCKRYIQTKSGLWYPRESLTEILFEQTIESLTDDIGVKQAHSKD